MCLRVQGEEEEGGDCYKTHFDWFGEITVTVVITVKIL